MGKNGFKWNGWKCAYPATPCLPNYSLATE